MKQSKFYLIIIIPFILAIGLMSLTPTMAAQSQPAKAVSDLWLDVSLGPPLLDWFNEVARPDDIARVEHVEQLDLLRQVTVGRKLVVFKSAAEAERFIPAVAGQVDIVGYNLEHGPANPVDEQADPIGSAKRMRALADEYGLLLAFGPDHDFAVSNGVDIAPYVDIFVLQIQRAQTEPAKVYDFVLPLIPQLRQANPDLQVSVQVRTEGNVVAIADLIDSFQSQLDGVSILTSPESVDIAVALVQELQNRTTVTAASDEIKLTSVPNGTNPAPANKAESTVIPPRTSPEGPLVLPESTVFWLIALLSALIGGGILGGVIVTLVRR
jgi:hypothetical protein